MWSLTPWWPPSTRGPGPRTDGVPAGAAGPVRSPSPPR